MIKSIVSEVEISYKNRIPYSQRQQVTNSCSAYEILKKIFPSDTIDYRETFIVLYLNKANQMLGYSVVSQGGTASTVVDTKMIMQTALLANASNILLAHNHPSGNLRPSIEDKKLTDRITNAGKLFDIRTIDHLIVTNESYYSFSDNGEI